MTNRYYNFGYSAEIKEIGPDFPQVGEMHKEYNYDSPDSITNLNLFDKFPPESMKLEFFVLKDRFKLTDLLSAAYMVFQKGLLVNEKLKKILEEYSLPTYKVYPAKVTYKKENHQYYWIHFNYDYLPLLDFTNTTFYDSQRGEFKMSSINEFTEYGEWNRINFLVKLYHEKLTLNLPKTFDLIQPSLCNSNFYITKTLMDRLSIEKISGIVIKDDGIVYSN